jgi:hypothetical protein
MSISGEFRSSAPIILSNVMEQLICVFGRRPTKSRLTKCAFVQQISAVSQINQYLLPQLKPWLRTEFAKKGTYSFRTRFLRVKTVFCLVHEMPKPLKTGLPRGSCSDSLDPRSLSSKRRLCPVCDRLFSCVKAVCAHVRYCVRKQWTQEDIMSMKVERTVSSPRTRNNRCDDKQNCSIIRHRKEKTNVKLSRIFESLQRSKQKEGIICYHPHCTLHTAHCTLHTVHCTLHTAHILYTTTPRTDHVVNKQKL